MIFRRFYFVSIAAISLSCANERIERSKATSASWTESKQETGSQRITFALAYDRETNMPLALTSAYMTRGEVRPSAEGTHTLTTLDANGFKIAEYPISNIAGQECRGLQDNQDGAELFAGESTQEPKHAPSGIESIQVSVPFGKDDPLPARIQVADPTGKVIFTKKIESLDSLAEADTFLTYADTADGLQLESLAGVGVDIAITGAGFGSDQNEFRSRASKAIGHVLGQEPFRSQRNLIRFHIVENARTDLQCTHRFAGFVAWSCNTDEARRVVEAAGVTFDKLVILIKDGAGGTATLGGTYAYVAGTPNMMIHEVGHLFGLYDEYALGNTNGPITGKAYANCFAGTPPSPEWVGIPGVEYHANCDGYRNYYRSSASSVMLGGGIQGYNAVSQKIIARSIQSILEPPFSSVLQFSSVATNTSVGLVWKPSSKVTGYEIELRSTGPNPASIKKIALPASSSKVQFENLQSGVSFEIAVKYSNSVGSKTYTTQVQTLKLAPTVVPRLVNLRAAPPYKVVGTIAYDQPWNETTKIERKVSGDDWELRTDIAVNAHSFTDFKVVPGKTYSYRAKAASHGRASPGEPSNVLSITPPEKFKLGPTGLKVTKVSADKAWIEWNDDVEADAFLVLSRSILPPRTDVIINSRTTATLVGLSSSSSYEVNVVSVTKDFESQGAKITFETPRESGALLTPENLSGMLVGDSIELSWSHVPEGLYSIQTTYPGGKRSFDQMTIKNSLAVAAKNCDPCEFRVKSRSRAGESTYSGAISVYEKPSPPPPRSCSNAVNPKEPYDTNNDGIVSPLDMMIIINAINGKKAANGTYPDVNGDCQINATDADAVRSYLNSRR